MPYLPHVCFILLAIPFVYGMTICPTSVLFPCLLMVGIVALVVVVNCIAVVVVACVA